VASPSVVERRAQGTLLGLNLDTVDPAVGF